MSVSTHGLGVMCEVCREVLVPDDCCADQPHGYGFQSPSEWASRTWPNHSCFQQESSADDRLTEADKRELDQRLDALNVDGWIALPHPNTGEPMQERVPPSYIAGSITEWAESILSTRLPAARAETWDEGHHSGRGDVVRLLQQYDTPATPNPYRAAEFRRAGQQQKEGQA